MQRLHNTHNKERKYKTKSTESLAIRLEICQPPDTIYVNSKLLWNSKRQTAAVHFIFLCVDRSLQCVFMSATNQNDFVAFIKLFAICVLSLSSSPSLLVALNCASISLISIKKPLSQHCCQRCSYLVHAISDFFCSCIQHTVVKFQLWIFFKNNLFVYRTIITSFKWMPHCC